MVQVALVGCGHIHTPGFVARLRKRSDVEVKAVWDHDAGRASRYAEELGTATTADASSIWSDADVSAVIICSETNHHPELVLAATEASKHLFVEKPLGIHAQDAYEMADAIERAGVLFQTGYFMRGAPVNRFLREQVEQGSFGKITRVRGSNGHAGSINGWFDTEYRWMADIESAGFGGFGDLGTHALDILLWLMGDVEAVTASIGAATGRYGDTDEYGEGMLQFTSGAIGTLAAGWVDLANPVTLLISGTEGHAYVLNGDMYLRSDHIDGADGKSPWTDLPEALPHAFELFLDAITGNQDAPLVTAREAALRTSVMQALYEGSRERAWVKPE